MRQIVCLFQWIKTRNHPEGHTHCLLEKYGGRITVEQLLCWLDKIGNLPARDALRQEYDSMASSLTF